LLRAQVVDGLEAKGGEVSARGRAAELGRAYLGLSAKGQRRFLHLLATEFGPRPQDVEAAIKAYEAAHEAPARQAAERALRCSLVSPRSKLLAQFNSLPNGIKFLVDLRAELRAGLDDDPSLRLLDADLRDLLSGWFDIGFLKLERITWRAPAALLEKLAAYEAVHRVRSWQDLKNRLDSDRRFYGFFHPNMPDEPLIFVEVALVSGLADNIQTLLDSGAPADDPARADTAIFYSISNAQRGLAGLSFGGFLIKRVLDDLVRDLPSLKVFATLSPIPGLRMWIEARIAEEGEALLTAGETRALKAAAERAGLEEAPFDELLAGNWHKDEALSNALAPALLRLAARYLLTAREADEPLDRVARLHLSNGARIERLNWLADISPNGLKQSYGIMVNYRYRPADIEKNHEAYRGSGTIAATSAVRGLLGGWSIRGRTRVE
jgi:malonyl-CoA decarboxylase